MSPFKVVEVSPNDDEITRQINEKAQEIADAQIQRLSCTKSRRGCTVYGKERS